MLRACSARGLREIEVGERRRACGGPSEEDGAKVSDGARRDRDIILDGVRYSEAARDGAGGGDFSRVMKGSPS